MSKPNLYLIPGLGVDKRIFQKLHLPDYNLVHISWISPLKQETLGSYALRLAGQINVNEPFYLLGVSFGGMLATEIAKYLKPVKTIIVSSITTKNELPGYLKLAARFHLDAIIPAMFLKSANLFSYWLFGTKTRQEKFLLKQILADIDPAFIKWALRAIARWENITVPDNLIHIHGDADKIIPIHNTNTQVRVNDGGHLMVDSRAQELSALIRDILQHS